MLDVRALPDEDMTQFVAELRRVIDDPAVEVMPPKTGGAAGVAALAPGYGDVPRAGEGGAADVPRSHAAEHDDRRHGQRAAAREGRAGLRHGADRHRRRKARWAAPTPTTKIFRCAR